MPQAGFHALSEGERPEVIEKIVARLREEGPILFAFLYGSFLSDPLFRDIDIGIFVRRMARSEYSAYEGELSRALEDALGLPLPVEVKVINDAPLPFRFSVITGRSLFTRDEDFLVSYMTRTAINYIDFAPLRRHYIREAVA
jgi:hypothetical protein